MGAFLIYKQLEENLNQEFLGLSPKEQYSQQGLQSYSFILGILGSSNT
jgi:hypothetical protein